MIPTQGSKWLLALLAVAAMAATGLGVAVAASQDSSAETVSEADSTKDEVQPIPVTLGGLQVSVDPETGELQPLSKAEARALADQMRRMFPPKTIDEATVRPDGSLAAVVVPNVLRLSVARVRSDGKVSLDCTDDLEGAIQFMTQPAVDTGVITKAEER